MGLCVEYVEANSAMNTKIAPLTLKVAAIARLVEGCIPEQGLLRDEGA